MADSSRTNNNKRGKMAAPTKTPNPAEGAPRTAGGGGGPTTMSDAEEDASLAGQHSTTTPTPQPKGAAAVVPAAGGGSSSVEHTNKVEDQQTLREQLQTLVSHKLRTLGDLDHAGLAALEALNRLPAARDQPPASGGGGSGDGSGGMKKKILPLGLEKIRKFCGKDPHYLTDCLNQFYSLVVAALPASSPSSVNKALNRDVVFVLEGSALKFFNSLKAGHVEWEPTAPSSSADDAVPDGGAHGGTSSHQQQQQEEDGQGGKRFRPPSTWTELYEAFHDHYLPVTGIARTSEKLFSSTQAPNESVLSLAQRQLGLATHLHRLIEANGKQMDFVETISIRLFERALRADLRRVQDAEPPCWSLQESVDRAQRNAIKLAKKPDSHVAQDNGGLGASSGPAALPAVWSAVASSDGGGGGVSLSGATPNHAHTSDHDCSEGDGQEERSSTNAPQGRNAVGSGRDAGQEAGEMVPPDDGSRSAPPWQQEADGGEEDGPAGFQKRHKKVRRGGQKRARDWQEMHRGGGGGGAEQQFPPPQDVWPVDPGAKRQRRARDWQEKHRGGGGADQQFQPPQNAWPVDPGAEPPCTLKECKTINRQFHCSNDCFYHPIHGERNRARGNYGRKKGFRRSQPAHRDPQYHNDGFWGQ